MTEPYYDSIRFLGMRFRRRTACDSVALDTPRIPAEDITTDPYAAEGKRLAELDQRARNGAIGTDYFAWRQAIGNDYYDEQDRIAGRLAANDNVRAGRVAA